MTTLQALKWFSGVLLTSISTSIEISFIDYSVHY